MGSVMRGKTAQAVRWIVKNRSAALCAEMGFATRGRVAPIALATVSLIAGRVQVRNSVVPEGMTHVLRGDVSVMTSV